MKEKEIEVMSETESKLVDILQRFEFTRATARTVVYMLHKKTAVATDIERVMDLRQPEVSVATKELRSLGILSKKDLPAKGKGRPVHQYKLTKSRAEVKSIITGGIKEKIKQFETDLKTIDALIDEMGK